MPQTLNDEHDELTADLARLIDAFRESPDQTILGWENLVAKAGLSDSRTAKAIYQSRRRRSGQGGQVVVLPHGRQHPTEYMLTTDRGKIARQRLRHQRVSYAYALHVYWSEHQQWDREKDAMAESEKFEMNYELRKSQELIASQEAKIVSVARSMGLSDRKIASFFRVQVSPNDPLTAHALA